MPRPLVPIPLSALEGGVNRFEREAQPNQAVDALDVFSADGDLRRRPGFASVATAFPHMLPAGLVSVRSLADGESATGAWSDRKGPAPDAPVAHIYVGCTEPFDGIWWTAAAEMDETPEGNLRLEVAHSAIFASLPGSATELGWSLDSTAAKTESGFMAPLQRDGFISWHRETFTWAETSVDGVSRYWIRLRLLDAAGEEFPFSPSVTWPGVHVFLLERINGLFSARLKGGKRVTLVASDRQHRRGVERGASVGVLGGHRRPTAGLLMAETEGTGIVGVQTWPHWYQLIAAVWTDQGASAAPTRGSSNKLTRADGVVNPGYEPWPNDKYLGGPLVENIQPTVASTTTSLVTASPGDVPAQRYEHCRVVCTVNGAAGTPVGQTREIKFCSSTGGVSTLQVYDAFTVAPNTGNRFSILHPPSVLRIDKDYEVGDSDATTVTIEHARPYTAGLSATVDTQPVLYQLGRFTRWSVDAGERWSMMYEPVRRRILMTNGASGILEFDGERLRRLVADVESDQAKAISGAVADTQALGDGGKNDTSLPRSALLADPPNAKFLCDFRGRIVAAHLAGAPNDIFWSAPGGFNNIWPATNYVFVRDAENNPISGMTTLLDRLIVWTPTAIFEGVTTGSPETIIFEPKSRGVGFISHHAVSVIPMGESPVLIGANVDGVYVYNGADPVPVLDSWERLLPAGVNVQGMRRAVAAPSLLRTLWFVAVPSRGSSSNDRLLVFDWTRKAWWVWSAPFGISAIHRVFDERGDERVLFGTDDGHLMVLREQDTDDGEVIDGYAVSAPLRPFGGYEGAFEAFQLELKTLGETETVEFGVYLDRQKVAWQEGEITPASGQSIFDTSTFRSS